MPHVRGFVDAWMHVGRLSVDWNASHHAGDKGLVMARSRGRDMASLQPPSVLSWLLVISSETMAFLGCGQ